MQQMKVIVANPRGFCAGVNMAIDVVDQVLSIKGPPIFVYHEIVHNRHVVDDFKSRGVTFVNDVADVPPGSTLVYSAHGISPAIRKQARQRNLTEVDATCPLVTKVHMEVLRYARDGYTIVFVGHRNHDEAIGTVGEAPANIVVVESAEEVDRLQVPDENKVAYVTQTTLSVSDCNRVVAALKKRFPNIRYPAKDDICYATTNRQDAVTQIAPEVDVVLVVGSQNSSNSQRLVDRAKEQGRTGYLIDDESELNPAWLTGKKAVLITAGASAPERLVEALIDRLKREFNATVESRTLVEEDISFDSPKSLKSLAVVR
jgi:4-hydroxy-3-methylbut-2-enyl diphosphate reductase